MGHNGERKGNSLEAGYVLSVVGEGAKEEIKRTGSLRIICRVGKA